MTSALAIYCDAADRANDKLVAAILAGSLPLGSLPVPAQARLARAGRWPHIRVPCNQTCCLPSSFESPFRHIARLLPPNSFTIQAYCWLLWTHSGSLYGVCKAVSSCKGAACTTGSVQEHSEGQSNLARLFASGTAENRAAKESEQTSGSSLNLLADAQVRPKPP